MVELLLHGHKSSALVNYFPHFEESELVKSVRPHVQSALVADDSFDQIFVKSSCGFHKLGVLVIFQDVHVNSDGVFEGQIHHLSRPDRAGASYYGYKSGVDA